MRFDLPDDKKLVYESLIPIRWGDMDAMGHVNNTVYFRFMEVVRLDWLQSIGAQPNPLGECPVIVNAFCSFIKQLEYPGTVRARHYVAQPGRTSFETYITLERTDEPGTVYASGGATTVWVDFPKRRSAPLPQWVRDLLL